MTVIGTIRGVLLGKRRRISLIVDESVPFGFVRVVGGGRVAAAYASAASWTANVCANLAAWHRPAGVP